MILNKTDFIQYQNCPKSLWLLKNKPDKYPTGEFSLFVKKLIAQGAEVEEFAEKLFTDGVKIKEHITPEASRKIIESNHKVFFQPSFETTDGVFARVDILEKIDEHNWHLYEVKSSTEIKTDQKHNHLKDACFQKYVLKNCGFNVEKVSIIHLNKEYIRSGEINPFGLLTITDVTEKTDNLYEQVDLEIKDAISLLKKEFIDEKYCSCRYNTRSNHCDSFSYFNPDIDEFSIYEIGNIRKNKIESLAQQNIFKLIDVPDDFDINERQALQVQSIKKKRVLLDMSEIRDQLENLQFPLHFIDYETFSTAVPKIDGLKPYQHVPFQVSIHSLSKNGEIEHFEFLSDQFELPQKLIMYMKTSTGKNGTFISWNKSFEKTRNNEMAIIYPEFSDYLEYMNTHMFDLQDIFKNNYMDYRFHGSTSIKAVLPVIIPDLSYKKLEVRDGTMAMDTWERMVLNKDLENNFPEREQIRKNLLEYCELDTMAMLKIYQYLINI